MLLGDSFQVVGHPRPENTYTVIKILDNGCMYVRFHEDDTIYELDPNLVEIDTDEAEIPL